MSERGEAMTDSERAFDAWLTRTAGALLRDEDPVGAHLDDERLSVAVQRRRTLSDEEVHHLVQDFRNQG